MPIDITAIVPRGEAEESIASRESTKHPVSQKSQSISILLWQKRA